MPPRQHGAQAEVRSLSGGAGDDWHLAAISRQDTPEQTWAGSQLRITAVPRLLTRAWHVERHFVRLWLRRPPRMSSESVIECDRSTRWHRRALPATPGDLRARTRGPREGRGERAETTHLLPVGGKVLL